MTEFLDFDENSNTFSEEAQTVLTQAGWTPQRSITIDSFYDTLEKKGFTVYASVSSFLTCFGGLLIEFKKPYLPRPEIVNFNIIKVARYFDIEKVRAFSRVHKELLCPIGMYDEEILLMKSSGEVYSGYCKTMAQTLQGLTGEQAIENMITSKYLTNFLNF